VAESSKGVRSVFDGLCGCRTEPTWFGADRGKELRCVALLKAGMVQKTRKKVKEMMSWDGQ
jgi:hypothetical protein